jgi:outer membrane usher protein
LSRRIELGAIAGRWLRCAGIVFLVFAMMPRLALATETETEEVEASAFNSNNDEKLLLEVQINGRSTGKIGEFTLHNDKLMARPDELLSLGFRVPVSRASETGGLISLSDLPGITFSIDQKNQILRVTAIDSALLPTVLLPGAQEALGGKRVIESGTGVTLNYDLAGTYVNGESGGTGSLGFQAFSPKGVLSSNWLVYAGAAPGPSGTNIAIRLDSAYTYADVNTLRRYSLGDFISSGLAWTRPVHLEGAQIRSDFSMRPDLITFPLPLITGSAAVPSTVSVLADGNLVVAGQINAGPFEIPQLPVITGAGTISMTVTNALGQQVNVTQSFYASPTLLKPGLQTFAGEAGLVRLNWGAVSNDYGTAAGTAIYRRGLTRKFTIEGTAQGTSGMGMVGAGGVLQVANLGVINFSAAESAGSGHPGALFSAGAQRIGRVLTLGASAIVARPGYQDIASMNSDPFPQKQLNGSASVSSKRFGSVGAGYAVLDQNSAPGLTQQQAIPAQHSNVFSANYSLQIHHMSLYATEFRDYGSSGGSNGLQIGLVIPLGRRSSVSASWNSDGIAELQAQQSAALIGDWGYEAYISGGNSYHEFAQGQYKSRVGLFTAGVDHDAGVTTLRLETQGALSFVDRSLFASNIIYDSFAIVDTSPVPKVRVYQENRPVGRTNSSGKLLVADMRSFDLNHIRIEPTDIPPEATINDDTRNVRPQALSGVVLKFPIHFNHAALLELVEVSGLPVPMGSTATLRATGAIVPVGYDGQAYVEDLSPHNELTVERPNGKHCYVAFDYIPAPGNIPSIGPLPCVEKKP